MLRWKNSFCAACYGLVLLVFVCGCGTATPGGTGNRGTSGQSAATFAPLHVVGNHFVNDAGQRIELQGVSYPHLEYDCTAATEYQLADFQAMHQWHINAVRLPLNAAFYLDEHNRCPDYRQRVRQAVQNAEAAHLYVMLALFWINPFDAGKSSGAGYPMPDQREAPDFWRLVAGDYATDGHVLFEVYSEPHDVSNAVWRDGGMVHNATTTDGRLVGDYLAVGMQSLVDEIHATAPARVTLVNTPNWGGTPGFIVAAGYRVQGQNVGYSAHIYDSGANNPHPTSWPATFGDLGDTTLVVAAEFGDTTACDGAWLRQALPYLRQHTAGYFAWAWSRDPNVCQQPSLISDHAGTPTSYAQPIYDFYRQH